MNEFSTGWQFSLPTINFDEVLKDKAVLAEVNKNLTLSQQFWGASSDTRVEDGRLQGLINGKVPLLPAKAVSYLLTLAKFGRF